jgi:hypothetical protein
VIVPAVTPLEWEAPVKFHLGRGFFQITGAPAEADLHRRLLFSLALGEAIGGDDAGRVNIRISVAYHRGTQIAVDRTACTNDEHLIELGVDACADVPAYISSNGTPVEDVPIHRSRQSVA